MSNVDGTLDRRWDHARRILVVRLDNLGDVLLMTPAIHAIRQSHPRAHIALWTSAIGAEVAAMDPDIDEIIVYEAPWMDPWHRLPQDGRRELAMIAELRRHKFDGAIIFTSYHQSALPAAYMCYVAGIPLRLAASIDGPGSLLTTRHRHPDRMMHEVERACDLVAAAGMRSDSLELVLTIQPEWECALRAKLAHMGISLDHPTAVVHAGCSMPARTYSAAGFTAVADALIDRLGVQVIFSGSPGERDLVERIRQGMRRRAYSVAGETSTAELATLIRMSDLVVTNNTGPGHIAAAVHTPVVVLFALTNPPEQWHPWTEQRRLLYRQVDCALCYARICPFNQECLAIPAHEVVDAAADLLTSKNEPPRKVGARC